MPTISIITAVQAGRDDYLVDTYESLRDQDMPPGWSWEWLVQEDGETGQPARRLPDDDPRVHFGMGRAGRACMARSVALARASGVLMRPLDADDLLPTDALRCDIAAVTGTPGVSWCVSPTLDLYPDGSTVAGPYDPAPGMTHPAQFRDGEAAGELQVVGGTLCIYTDLVRALGGWYAVPAGEDVELLLAAEAVSQGYMRGGVGLYYRKWGGSSTHDPEFARDEESEVRRQLLLQRADALTTSGWRWTPSPARDCSLPHTA